MPLEVICFFLNSRNNTVTSDLSHSPDPEFPAAFSSPGGVGGILIETHVFRRPQATLPAKDSRSRLCNAAHHQSQMRHSATWAQ
jgi:hypothetical protein